MTLDIETSGVPRHAILFGANLAEAAERPLDALYFIEALSRGGGLDDDSGEMQCLAEVAKNIIVQNHLKFGMYNQNKRDEGISLLHQCMKARRRRGTAASVLATAELHMEYLAESLSILNHLSQVIDEHVIPNCTSSKRKLMAFTIAADLHRAKAHMMRPLKGSPLEADESYTFHHEQELAKKRFEDANHERANCKDYEDVILFFSNAFSCYLYEKGDKKEAIKVAEDTLKDSLARKSPNYIMLANNLRIWKNKVVLRQH